jgi:hypothetical protein
MITFREYVDLIREDNMAAGGGVFGDGPSFGHGGAVGNSDFYAPGDARIPFALGYFSRQGKLRKKKKRKSKRRKSRKRKKSK